MVDSINNAEQNCLVELKKELSTSNELEEFRTFMDDEFLMHFVRGKKCDLDKAARAVRGYWNVRKHKYNFVFKDINNLEENISPVKCGFFRVLKARDLGKLFIGCDFGHWPEEMRSTDDLTRSSILVLEEMWNDVLVEREGIVGIVNLREFGWKQMKFFTPLGVYRLTNIFWNNMPIRYRAIHLINAGRGFTAFFNSVKHFLPKTMRERLIIHDKDLSKLHAEIPPNALPTSLGGSLSEEDAYDKSVVDNILNKKDYYDRLVSLLNGQ